MAKKEKELVAEEAISEAPQAQVENFKEPKAPITFTKREEMRDKVSSHIRGMYLFTEHD